MADVNKDRFIERLNAIQQKSDPKKKVVRKVNKDGLVVEVVKPRRKKLLPIKSMVTIALIFVMFKGFVLAQLGADEYESRIDTLKKGPSAQVFAAFLLDSDPATEAMARGLRVVMPGK
ncbi:hypothetical protein SAMN05444273_103428 [Litoreibacter ascidiaceicola]|uniref:Uncharacterized protein n=1 Tax=Litoreibacter ascidiaceicola TaxID=1486859 RepID=A0A1M4Y6J8_9RHOB|nr:hypothetical protein [Litoreibacter ascidiaceicola]SHF01082.1 hypothetical protein SAMN05444273_103428 [Litoreibacter ascidiaceicola]